MTRTPREIIIIDDYQYIMANEFMRRAKEKGYDKFADIGEKAWTVFNTALKLPMNRRIYFFIARRNRSAGKPKSKPLAKCLMKNYFRRHGYYLFTYTK